jgi:transposase
MKSPPRSPDLNPIELVWADLKKYVRMQRCVSEYDAINAVKRFWSKITPEYCGNYINHLRKVKKS